MEKIIAALDGLQLSRSAIEYTQFIARNSNAHIVGVFLEDMLYHSFGYSELAKKEGGFSETGFRNRMQEDQETRKNAVQEFREMVEKAGLPYSVHKDRNVAVQELIHESVYADLLIIDSKESFNRFQTRKPSPFLRELLGAVHCPVLVVPQSYTPPDKVVMLYDGSPSSVHAIKMLSYLVPYLKYLETEVISVLGEKDTNHIPDNRLMKEFLQRHFPNAAFTVLRGDPRESVIAHISIFQENALLVTGAYERGRVSRWFRSSLADEFIKRLNLPVFIAHEK